MPSLTDIICQFLLPSFIVASCILFAWHPWKNKKRNGRWIGAAAVSAAFATAASSINGIPHWPPGSGDASNWLIWFCIPISLLGLLDAIFSPPIWLRAILLLILSYFAIKLLIAPLPNHPRTSTLVCMAAIAEVWCLFWDFLADDFPGISTPLLLTLTLAASAAIFALANDIKPAQIMIAMTGTLAVATLAAWRWPAIQFDRGAILAWTLPLLGLLVLVHFYYYTEPPISSVGLLLIAPLLVLALDMTTRNRSRRVRWIARTIPLIVALAIAVGISTRQFLQAQAADESPASQPDASNL